MQQPINISDIPVEDILTRFEAELFEYVDTKYPEVPKNIRTEEKVIPKRQNRIL